MKEAWHFLLLVPLQILIFGGMYWAAWRWLRSRKPSAFPKPILTDGAGGRVVPLQAAFAGLRGLPWVAVAYNNANPSLVITADGLAFRVLRRQMRTFAEIERVDLLTFGASVVLRFCFTGRPLTFDAGLGSLVLARQVLELLPAGVPLSDRATALLREV